MKITTENTRYHFEVLAMPSIKERLDYGKAAGLRDLAASLRRDSETLERFADAVAMGASYSVGPTSACAWWGWG